MVLGGDKSRRGRVSRNHCYVQKPGVCLAGHESVHSLSDLLCLEFRENREVDLLGARGWPVHRVDICLGILPDSSLPSGHSERRERITHGAAMSSTLVWNTKTCLPQLEKTNLGTGLHGKPYSSLQLCLSFHAWSLLTETQHAWLRCSSPRAGPLSLGARWDLPSRMDYLALHNSP